MKALDVMAIILILILLIIFATSNSGEFNSSTGGTQTVFDGKTLEVKNYTDAIYGGSNVNVAHIGETYSEKHTTADIVVGNTTGEQYVVADHRLKGYSGFTENNIISEEIAESNIESDITYENITLEFVEIGYGEESQYYIYTNNGSYYCIDEYGQATIIVDGETVILQSIGGGKVELGKGSGLIFDNVAITKIVLTVFGVLALGIFTGVKTIR